MQRQKLFAHIIIILFCVTLISFKSNLDMNSSLPLVFDPIQPEIPKASYSHLFIDSDQALLDYSGKTGTGTYDDPFVIRDLQFTVFNFNAGVNVSNLNYFLRFINISINCDSYAYGFQINNCLSIMIDNCSVRGYAWMERDSIFKIILF